MGKAVVRVNDSTSGNCDTGSDCCPHGRNGQINSGSNNVTVNSKPAHRNGDSGTCNCPHGGSFTTEASSKTVTVNGKPLALNGDSNSCASCGSKGNITSGSENVTSG